MSSKATRPVEKTMSLIFMIATLLAAVAAGNSQEEFAETCPLWMTQRDGECLCREFSFTEEVFCDPATQTTYVAAGACVTYDNSNREIAIGYCPGDRTETHSNFVNLFFIPLPENESELNDVMCGPFNRQGFLCSSCRPGYGVSMYSFGYSCGKCDEYHLGILWYTLLVLTPTTLLYFLVLLLRVRATSAPLAGLVIFYQMYNSLITVKMPLYASLAYSTNTFVYNCFRISLVFSGIWDLTFPKFVIPPLCLSENIGSVHAVALGYVSALYPLFLVFITFLVIRMYARNVYPVVWIWRRLCFRKICSRLRKTWDIECSIINAFSTFIFLSYSQMVLVSFKLLDMAPIYDINGTVIKRSLRIDSTINSGQTHTPFAVIAIFMIITFGIFPILLLLFYPTRLFQKCLRTFRCRATHCVHIFVDTYQGCLKDGTNGTRDYRIVPAVYLVLRFGAPATWIIGHLLIDDSGRLAIGLFSFLFITMGFFIAIFRPYKEDYMNYCELGVFFLLGNAGFAVYLWLFSRMPSQVLAYVFVLIGLLPQLVLTCYIAYLLFRGRAITQWIKKRTLKYKSTQDHSAKFQRFKYFLSCFKLVPAELNNESDEDNELPDRFLCPDVYAYTLTTQYTQYMDHTKSPV